MEIKQEQKDDSKEILMERYKQYKQFFGKRIYISGKSYFYAYFSNEKLLEEAIMKSLMEDMEGVWVILPKRKNFLNIISTRISQNENSNKEKIKPLDRNFFREAEEWIQLM